MTNQPLSCTITTTTFLQKYVVVCHFNYFRILSGRFYAGMIPSQPYRLWHSTRLVLHRITSAYQIACNLQTSDCQVSHLLTDRTNTHNATSSVISISCMSLVSHCCYNHHHVPLIRPGPLSPCTILKILTQLPFQTVIFYKSQAFWRRIS